MTLFVDSSFIIALFHKKDDFHSEAEKIVKELVVDSPSFLTSNIAVAEAINYIFRTRGSKAAKKILNLIDKSGIETVFVSQDIFKKAYKLLFARKSKRGLNFFDCLHLATMRILGIETILSFDKGFKKEVKVIGI